MHESRQLDGIGWRATAALFGTAAALLWLMTGPLNRLLLAQVAIEPVVAWFLLGGLGVFLPILLLSLMAARQQGVTLAEMPNRLRFRKLDAGDWRWTLFGLAGVSAATVAIMVTARQLGVPLEAQPAFMRLKPLEPDQYWIVGVWLPFWILNILSEEIAWRGVILPRQAISLGRWAWLANALGWLLFHLAFGWQIMILLLPIVFILPWIVQRRGNSSIGIVLHATLNGPGFLAVALGLV